MTPIFHLVLASDFALGEHGYAPASLASEGFVHACGTPEVTLDVAHAYFANTTGKVWVLELATDGLDVRWEHPAPPDGKPRAHHVPGRTFPHVYGAIPLNAIRAFADLPRVAGAFGWPARWQPGAPG